MRVLGQYMLQNPVIACKDIMDGRWIAELASKAIVDLNYRCTARCREGDWAEAFVNGRIVFIIATV